MLTFFRKRRRVANSSLINRDLGNRELLRSAEEAERLDSVPTFRTMRELEEYDRRQREQTANHVLPQRLAMREINADNKLPALERLPMCVRAAEALDEKWRSQ